jgi:glycosidase
VLPGDFQQCKGLATVLGLYTRKFGAWLLGRRLGLAAMGLAAALAAAGPTAAQQRSWADEVMYFVLIDRFADGDPTNNQGVDRRNPGGWHGGDLKGLTQQLDELRDLGVTALWINPVQLQQARGMTAQAAGAEWFTHEGFHGYWIQDFEQMDPHFGSEADLKRLVDEARKRGIKVVLDVVINHAGYSSRYSERRTASGEPWLRQGEGNCEVDAIRCAVGGLPDFRTEIPEVRDHLIGANIALARRSGVAGFRLDTYKHVSGDVWAEHRRRTREALGRDFFLLAEHWGGDAQSLDGFFERDEVDAGFDFSFKGNCESWVTGRGRTVAYAAYLRGRHKVRPGYLLAHYLSSHDEPMMLGNLQGNRSLKRLCVALQMTSLGMPVIYYGEEVARGGHEWPLQPQRHALGRSRHPARQGRDARRSHAHLVQAPDPGSQGAPGTAPRRLPVADAAAGRSAGLRAPRRRQRRRGGGAGQPRRAAPGRRCRLADGLAC